MIKIINLCENLKHLRINEIKTYDLSKETKKKHLESTIKIENENTNRIAHLLKYFSDLGYEKDFFDEIFDNINKKIEIDIKNNAYVVYCETLIYLSKKYKEQTQLYLSQLKKTNNN
jgi:hypothetical protein